MTPILLTLFVFFCLLIDKCRQKGIEIRGWKVGGGKMVVKYGGVEVAASNQFDVIGGLWRGLYALYRVHLSDAELLEVL